MQRRRNTMGEKYKLVPQFYVQHVRETADAFLDDVYASDRLKRIFNSFFKFIDEEHVKRKKAQYAKHLKNYPLKVHFRTTNKTACGRDLTKKGNKNLSWTQHQTATTCSACKKRMYIFTYSAEKELVNGF
jgi:hypothetical protein